MRITLRSFSDLRVTSVRFKRGQPLHARLGIATHVHRQAILNDPRMREWDQETRVWSHNHLYRDSITLAGVS